MKVLLLYAESDGQESDGHQPSALNRHGWNSSLSTNIYNKSKVKFSLNSFWWITFPKSDDLKFQNSSRISILRSLIHSLESFFSIAEDDRSGIKLVERCQTLISTRYKRTGEERMTFEGKWLKSHWLKESDFLPLSIHHCKKWFSLIQMRRRFYEQSYVSKLRFELTLFTKMES